MIDSYSDALEARDPACVSGSMAIVTMNILHGRARRQLGFCTPSGTGNVAMTIAQKTAIMVLVRQWFIEWGWEQYLYQLSRAQHLV